MGPTAIAPTFSALSGKPQCTPARQRAVTEDARDQVRALSGSEASIRATAQNRPSYARVDMVLGDSGPLLMEWELI